MNVGGYNFDFHKEAVIMGILNVTPDSFSDGGKFNNLDAALMQTERMIQQGASIIDVGGESTRPGYTLIPDEEEINRVVPVIEAINDRFDIPISIDTYKAAVAGEAIKAGAGLINDIWGFKWVGKDSKGNALSDKHVNKDMAELAAKTGVAVCLMHNRYDVNYNNFVEDVVNDLRESVAIAKEAGVKDSQIMLDPGVGFAKDLNQNLTIINHVDRLLELGYPVLLGTSRKSVIGLTLDVDRDDRVSGTVATTVVGYERGCRIFRVHDVKENYQALKMTEAIWRTYGLY